MRPGSGLLRASSRRRPSCSFRVEGMHCSCDVGTWLLLCSIYTCAHMRHNGVRVSFSLSCGVNEELVRDIPTPCCCCVNAHAHVMVVLCAPVCCHVGLATVRREI